MTLDDQRNSDVSEALDAAQLAIEEYYNGDRAWAAIWLLKAYQANQYPLKELRSLAQAEHQDQISYYQRELVCDFHDGQPASTVPRLRSLAQAEHDDFHSTRRK